jgi:anti-sigma B factor antagonist
LAVLEFTVKTAELGADAFVVTITGEADLHNAPELDRALQGVLGLGGTSVAVDLGDVTFIDSTTLGVLLRFQPRFTARGGELVIVTQDRRVIRTFEITGLDKVFRIEQRLADGVASLMNGSGA